MNRRLLSNQYDMLNWDWYKGMVRIYTQGDGSCFFHALLNSFFSPYITNKIGDGSVLAKREFVKNFREDLSLKLNEKVEGTNKTWYETISRGHLKKMSETLPKYKLEEMQKVLNSSSYVDNLFNEFISDIISKDIYLLDMNTKNIYVTGKDDDILYKKRKSIVILYIPESQHYELVGVMRVDSNSMMVIKTIFDYNDDFILKIREKMKEMTG